VRAGRIATVGCLGLLLGAVLWFVEPWAVPSFEEVRSGFRPSEVVVRDHAGGQLARIRVDHSGRRWPWVQLTEVSPHLVSMMLRSEDRRFYGHRGIDPVGVLRALLHRSSRREGASTITMQLVAMITGRRGRASFTQKVREAAQALWLEVTWRKAEILEAWLNHIPIRGELVGVASAAAGLFDVAPGAIAPEEGAIMAALVRAPGADAPLVAVRSCRLLGDTPTSGGCARLTERLPALLSRPRVPPAEEGSARHLARRLARTRPDGGQVSTAIDPELQRFIEERLPAHILPLGERGAGDAAVLVVENTTGRIVGYAGGIGPGASREFVDGVQARRLAGSTLKPFLYARAIERRLLTAATLIEDTSHEVAVAGGLYRPRNYDRRFRGAVPVRMALGSSLNVPAVRTLALIGEDDFGRLLGDLGFTALAPASVYGPSLALGSAAVSLEELVGAYRTLARGGRAGPLRLEADRPVVADRLVLGAESVWITTHMLADRAARHLTFGFDTVLGTPGWSAVKTGTSRDMVDNWCVGFSSRFTVGVWVGNFSGSPMHDVSGVSGAAPLWAESLGWLGERYGWGEPPPPPPGVIEAAGEWFLGGTEPRVPAAPLVPPRARIRSPAAGSIFALDRDIPPDRQRVQFRATGEAAGLTWELDGRPIGHGVSRLTWSLEPGEHLLVLRTQDGEQLDAVRFTVRG